MSKNNTNKGYGDYNHSKKQNDNRPQVSKPKRRKQETDFSISLTGKHVFGAYFNMARTNFVKTINYILPIAGVGGNYSENQINKMLHALFLIYSNRADELTPEQKQWKKKLMLDSEQQTRLQRLLFKHFPVLVPIMADTADHRAYINSNKKKSNVLTEEEVAAQLKGVSLPDCLEVIALMGDTLTECRNFYTHNDPYNSLAQLEEQYRHQEAMARKLDKVVVASRRVLKDREGLSIHEMEFLTGIDHMKSVVTKDEKGQVVTDKKGRPQKKFMEYDDFYFKISGIRTIKSETVYAVPALSDFGLLYFCTLFLSKNYAKFFIDEARLFEFSPFNENENLIMQEMLAIYRIRLPRAHRIDSRDNKATLAMDIFGEMRRCPIELYDLLDKKEGQPFFHDEVKRPNSHTPEISKCLRYNDRFPHLALRYIDLEELFKRIRFQLQLGSFRYKFYDKECIDGKVRVRRIQKDINGYGRLQEVEDKRMEKWGDIIQKREEHSVKLEHEDLYIDLDQFVKDSADSTPYLTDRRPSYNIHANRIGLFWEESQDKRKYEVFDENNMYLPQLNVSENPGTVKMPAPRCSLSVHDLPALLFYEYLRSHSDEATKYPSAERIIIDCENDYRRFFGEVANGTLKPFANEDEFDAYLDDNYSGLLKNDIPEKIRLYLSSKGLMHDGKTETVRQRLVRLTLEHLTEREKRVERRLEHYRTDKKKVGDKENKVGKKDYADIRHGAIARYLAQSMMEWQPSQDGKGHDKLTGLNYNVLTAYLATYGSPNATLTDDNGTHLSLAEVLRNARLSGGTNPHPFIDNVLACHNPNIEQFYENYLEEELRHIRSCLRSLRANSTDDALKEVPFVHHQRVRFNERTVEEMRALAAKYTTIQLPDGLFTPNIVELLEEQYSDNEILMRALSKEYPDELNPTHNSSYLITLFYQSVLNDDAQPFYHSDKTYIRQIEGSPIEVYNFKRSYELFDILKNEKEKTFPFELIRHSLTCDEIQKRLTDKVLGKKGGPIPKLDGNSKPVIGSCQRKIEKEIEEFIENCSDKDLKISQNQPNKKKEEERKEKREALRNRLKRQINEIKNNERAIRRHKTHDMVLFLLAKQMFVDLLGEQARQVNWKQMKLSKVCNDAFLRQTLTYRFPVPVGDKTIYVEQENMSIKNYGEFYRFLGDDRLMSLLGNIVDRIKPDSRGQLVISHTDLMGELAAYDQRRATVFKLIQRIEASVIDTIPALRNPECDDFWVDDKKELPKRNNFRSLLNILDRLNDAELTDDERSLIVAIRNAFGHNSYNIDLSLIDNIGNLPEVANGILHHLVEVSGFTDE